MASHRTKSGLTLYRIEDKPKPMTRSKRRVYIIKGGKASGHRTYDENDANAVVAKYGGRITSKNVITLS